MQRIIILVMVALFTATLPLTVYAATSVTVDNYFYAHANTAGTFYFSDKYSSTTMYGDGIEHDATIKGVTVSAQGLASGDKIMVYPSGGGSFEATPGQKLDLNVSANQYIRIAIEKAGTNEVFAKLDYMDTLDASEGGTEVHYIFSVNDIPTSYGDLGPGSGGEAPDTVSGNYYYWSPTDQYKYDYTAPTGVSYYQLHFTGSDGTPYMRQFDQTPTGVHYLTCNGTYVMKFFDSTGGIVAQSPDMVTTEIQSPTCNSQPGAGDGYHDFTLTREPDSELPEYDMINWDAYPGAYTYDIYMNGELIHTCSCTVLRITKDSSSYSVIARDEFGNFLAQADLAGTDPGGGSGDPGGDPGGDTGGDTGTCDQCTKLSELLACPEWSQYMGDLTQAIQNALPPPPDWDLIADKIGAATINHLSTYLGDVPDVPTSQLIKEQTNQPMPPVDTSVPAADELVPSVPPDFNTPKPFDIENGPQIDVTDNSQPFIISDPLSGLQIDDPGTPVIPGDDRNSSGGIKSPDIVDTGEAATPAPPPSEAPPVPGGTPDESMPTPTAPSSTVPDPVGDIPENPMPTPSGTLSEGPVPTVPTTEIPIPTQPIQSP